MYRRNIKGKFIIYSWDVNHEQQVYKHGGMTAIFVLTRTFKIVSENSTNYIIFVAVKSSVSSCLISFYIFIKYIFTSQFSDLC
jgi:hypothetical protein